MLAVIPPALALAVASVALYAPFWFAPALSGGRRASQRLQRHAVAAIPGDVCSFGRARGGLVLRLGKEPACVGRKRSAGACSHLVVITIAALLVDGS